MTRSRTEFSIVRNVETGEIEFRGRISGFDLKRVRETPFGRDTIWAVDHMLARPDATVADVMRALGNLIYAIRRKKK